MSFNITEYLIILFLIFFQSFFGVGLLVFGTPTFLILDYSFQETLSILLPISLCVSGTQLFTLKLEINKFKKIFLRYSLFGLIIFLPISFYMIKLNNLKIIVSITMILTSVITLYNINIKNFRINIISYSKILLFLIGCIHGLTNLGGGLISLYSSILYFGNKLKSRKAIAFSYFIFASIQLLVLFITSNFYFRTEVIYLITSIPIIFYFSSFIFKKINFEYYIKVLYLIILLYGVSILVFLL